MHEVDCTGLLVQDNPDALVLAVLCDFGDRKPKQVVGQIVRRLRELIGDDDQRFREYMTMREVLSENRDLKAQVQEAEKMLTQFDVTRLPSHANGFEDGEAAGKAEAQRQLVRRLLMRLDPLEVASLRDISIAEIQRSASDDDSNDPGW